jgi:3-oxoacyl-[acyl-carrier protein] reductase
MDLGLNGRRALVGGGGSGIGAGIAAALAAEGARVALVGRTADRLEAEAAKLGGAPVVADLSTPDGAVAAVDAAVAALGGLDLVLVNTGGPATGTIESMTDVEWATAIDGTLNSVLRLIRAALPRLREGTDPSILIVLSSSVREPIPGLTASNVLRPGLAGLIKSSVAEIAPDQRPRAGPDRDGPHRLPRRPSCRGGRRDGRGDRPPDDGDDPARPLRRGRGDRARRGLPAVAGGVVRHRGHRAGRRGHDPVAPVASSVAAC